MTKEERHAQYVQTCRAKYQKEQAAYRQKQSVRQKRLAVVREAMEQAKQEPWILEALSR